MILGLLNPRYNIQDTYFGPVDINNRACDII